jgi:hypothetical protein
VFSGQVLQASQDIFPLVAGPMAGRLDQLGWSRAVFLAMPRAHRHLVGYACAAGRLRKRLEEAAARNEWPARASLRDLMAALLPNPPAGLPRALDRIEDSVLWPAAAYRELAAALADDSAAKHVRHCTTLSREALSSLVQLPAAWRSGGLLRALDHPDHASALREAHDVMLQSFGPSAIDFLGVRFDAAASAASAGKILLEVANVFKTAPGLPDAPPAGLRRLRSAREVAITALAFNNCLRDYTERILSGRSVVYVADGAPQACIELRPEGGFGWSIGQLYGPNNARVSTARAADIQKALLGAGLRLCPVNASGVLKSAAARLGCPYELMALLGY